MTAMVRADQVYLTVTFWPDGMPRDEVAGLIADAAGIDRRLVTLKLGKNPPTILGLFPRATADRAVAAMTSRGGDAFVASFHDLEALGATLKIRDLRMHGGEFCADLWRGPSERIIPTDIQIVVRARMSEKQPPTPPTALEASHNLRWTMPGQLTSRRFALGGAFGMAAAFGYMLYVNAQETFDEAIPATDVRTSHKLDLHTCSGKVYQIDGDKFGFQILGELRGHSDNQNIDAICELVATLNPDVIVDPYFTLWRPPAAHERLRLPMKAVNQDDPAFAFYSRWTALMYRHILASRQPK